MKPGAISFNSCFFVKDRENNFGKMSQGGGTHDNTLVFQHFFRDKINKKGLKRSK